MYHFKAQTQREKGKLTFFGSLPKYLHDDMTILEYLSSINIIIKFIKTKFSCEKNVTCTLEHRGTGHCFG